MNKLTRLSVLFFALFSFLFFFTKNSFAVWYYPMDKYYERQTVKGFGEYIDNSFYKGKEALYPFNRFYGYHTAVDLEVFPEEINTKVPVYAAFSGTITYIGTLSGYGGVILEKIDNENNTFLYGHVKIDNLSFKVGDHVNAENSPVILTYLGNQFSAETSKERKHLHLGIYKRTDLYFKGHESSLAQLEKRWLNPNTFLKEKEAIDPVVKPTSITTPTNIVKDSEDKKSFFSLLLNSTKQLLGRL